MILKTQTSGFGPPACSLEKVGQAIVFYVEGFDAVSFESKGYGYDLGMLEGQFEEWGVSASGPVFDKLHHELQAVHGEGEGDTGASSVASVASVAKPAMRPSVPPVAESKQKGEKP